MKLVTVLIADDHKIVRQGLINLLSAHPWIKVVGEAENGRETIKMANSLLPDVIVIDIGMPELNGIEATKQIIANHSNAKVIALTIHNSLHYVQEMIKNGASGYLLKDCAVDELVEAIRNVSENKYYISKTIAESAINVESNIFENASDLTQRKLSDREKEVLQLLAEGNSTKQIGEKLSLSPKTIESHRKNIMDKLRLYTVPDLTKYAIKNGIIELD